MQLSKHKSSMNIFSNTCKHLPSYITSHKELTKIDLLCSDHTSEVLFGKRFAMYIITS